jgi:hypothetical protein
MKKSMIQIFNPYLKSFLTFDKLFLKKKAIKKSKKSILKL